VLFRSSLTANLHPVVSPQTLPLAKADARILATDLDGDHFLDITTVNEVTADLRVFMSRGDFSGQFHDFNRPPSPVNNRASPSEPADFNADGIPDICVANIDTSTVSILLGIGDGTFAPQQQVAVGGGPRGIAVLDADGDGDMDIVNTNSASSNLSLLIKLYTETAFEITGNRPTKFLRTNPACITMMRRIVDRRSHLVDDESRCRTVRITDTKIDYVTSGGNRFLFFSINFDKKIRR